MHSVYPGQTSLKLFVLIILNKLCFNLLVVLGGKLYAY